MPAQRLCYVVMDGWQIGCPVDCARPLEDSEVPCRIAPGWAVGAVLGTTTGPLGVDSTCGLWSSACYNRRLYCNTVVYFDAIAFSA